MTRLAACMLPDGRRMYLHDGPIELIVEAWGAGEAVRASYDAARRRAETILDDLCSELQALRRPAREGDAPLRGVVAQRMQRAVAPYAPEMFITPMAAVAGAVAEEVLEAMCAAATLDRAYVNNGGDIAVHMAPGASFVAGLVDRPDRPSLFAKALLTAEDGVGDIATSGWRGRSHSLGVADAASVLAGTAAQADAAATVIANAVDLPDHPAVRRVPCIEIDPDNDLGQIPVTREVGPLKEAEVSRALGRGIQCAHRLITRGSIHAAALHLQGTTLVAKGGRVAGRVAC